MININADLQSNSCQNITYQIGSPDSWYNNGAINDYLIDCNQQTIHISGSGIFKVKSNLINTFPNGLINLINSNFECSMSKIYASGVASENVQLINLQGTGIHSIIGTNFEFCGIYPYLTGTTSANWDPSLIVINGDSNNLLTSVKFINPDTNNPDPQLICQTRSIKIEGNCSLIIENSDFYNSSCYTKGSFLCLSTETNISILNCNFQECISLSDQAHAIYITNENAQTITIDNCSFIDCSKNHQGYAIQFEVPEFIFSNCKISFSNTICGGGIKIDSLCFATIINTEFCDFHFPSAIYYDPIIQESELEATISGCLFTGFKMIEVQSSDFEYSVFRFGPNINVLFYNNTIKNYEPPEVYCPNLFIGKIANKIENCSFINNIINGLDTGGAGLVFSGDYVQIINCIFLNNTSKLIFDNCGGIGGAIHFNSTNIEIDSCTFINNKSDLEGGALSIECNSSYIHNTTFIGNQAGQSTASSINSNHNMGGAIYFNRKNIGEGSYVVSNCTFKNNNGDENGHAILITGELTKVIVSNSCNFDCNSKSTAGSQILINENASIEISNSTIHISDNIKLPSRGIELLDGMLNVHHSIFTNLEAPVQNSLREGNAIVVNRYKNNAIIEDNQFIDCYYTDQFSFIVKFDGNSLDFFRNTFDFPQKNGCGCLRIYTSGNVIIHDNIFQNAITPSNFNGVFIYEENEITSNENQNIIENNIFDNIHGQLITCFNFKWISNNYIFYNNTLKNNDSINKQGEFNFMSQLNSGTFYFGGNNFINNTSRGVYGGGAGILFKNSNDNNYLYENHFTIIIDKSNFIGNHEVEYSDDKPRYFRNGNGGAIQIGWTEEFSNVDVEILNSNFSKNYADRQGGAINLQIIGYIIITNCTFDENIAGLNTTDPLRINGGAVYILCDFFWNGGHYPSSNGGVNRYSDSIKITGSKFNKNFALNAMSIFIEDSEHTDLFIIDCQFIDNLNSEYTNYSIIYKNKEFIFENSTIEFTDITKSSCGIKIIRPIKIINSHFIKNCLHDKNLAEALLVEAETNQFEIANSTFEDCGWGGNDYSIIKIKSKSANIHNNIFNFTYNKQENSCQAVLILEYCYLIFCENTISNSYCNGGLQYNPTSNGDLNNENLLIEKCTFENCQGINTRALNIKLSTEKILFANNTFKDCSVTGVTTSGGYLIGLDLELTNISEFVMDRIIFKNLSTDSDFSGGIGCLIKQNKEYEILFKNCIFDGNHACFSKTSDGCNNGKGGAFQYGWSSSFSNISLIINGCIFNQNKADQEGGALCLMIQGNIEIRDCEFINNKAGVTQTGEYFGGAISITPNKEYQQTKPIDTISIENCSFIGNSGHDADSIYVNKSPETDLYISNNCQFISNSTETGSHFTIICYSQKIEICDCFFEFSSISISSSEITSSHTYLLRNCIFKKSNSNCAIHHSQTLGTINLLSIEYCIFEDCLGQNVSCLYFTFLGDFNFEFKNSIIQYTNETICDKYLYSFYFISKSSLTIENVSFINITNTGLYGCACITGINQIIFDKCIFKGNTALQTQNGENIQNLNNKVTAYYGGDGGGLQYGYSDSLFETEIEIRNCLFQNNKATRHGGGIALQTTRTVSIINCSFEENRANYYHSDTTINLLFDNYFDLKTVGRGGALYLNPTFMKKIEIVNSTFKSNSAFDGCAIYIEGDENGTDFNIQQNTFIDNFYDGNPKSIKKGIIASEMYNLFKDEIETQNAIINNDPMIDTVLYVDHYGNIPTDQFTQSQLFPSNEFTKTQYFSPSRDFTLSKQFSITNYFTSSNEFNQSMYFSQTNYFSNSDEFTSSFSFTISSVFTGSQIFSPSLPPTPTEIQLESNQQLSFEKSFIVTYTQLRTVSFSISCINSITFLISFDQVYGTYGLFLTQSNYYKYFPYIIYYLSPSYIQTFIPIIMIKKTITKEQLIGICSGTASIFFLILGIIILAVKNKNRIINQKKEIEEFSTSSDQCYIINKNEKKKNNNENDNEHLVQINDESDADLNFWL